MEVAPSEFPLHPPSLQVAAASLRLRRAIRVEAERIKSRRWRRWLPVITVLLLWLRGRIAQVVWPQASSWTLSSSVVVRQVHAQTISSCVFTFRQKKEKKKKQHLCHFDKVQLPFAGVSIEWWSGQMWSSETPLSGRWRYYTFCHKCAFWCCLLSRVVVIVSLLMKIFHLLLLPVISIYFHWPVNWSCDHIRQYRCSVNGDDENTAGDVIFSPTEYNL